MSHSHTTSNTPVAYEMGVVRQFAIMTVIWGIVGMAVGVFIAAELVWPFLNFDTPWLTFSRLRPLHTNAVIFAFGGCALFACSYYIVQRTTQTPLFMPKLAKFTFWGWQLVIVLAAVTLPLGYTSTREYAELEWPIDILIAIVWICYGTVFFGTLATRRSSHIYVANWFFGAFIITIGLLHILNNIAVPVSMWKSYSMYSGTTDAMIQWWYGHNAVGFYLTAAFLGMMYYFIPIQVGRPVYSYRLSIVHFWALISVYMWAGGHHLHYSALPDWTQSLAMAFSIVLFAPSWGGMINGIMTLSTFEGPMMSIKTVNALSHNTDWTVGHVHSGALGWLGMITIGSLYILFPRLWDRERMYSIKLINLHFWLATIGTIFYIASLWVSGITQGLMWRAVNDDGSLTYTFVEAVKASHPYWFGRFIGGALYLSGMFVMAYNVAMTIANKKPVDADTLK